MTVATISAIVGPLSLLTGYYGMNVKEFVPGTELGLIDVWQVGMPVAVVTLICVAIIGLWLVTSYRSAVSTAKN